MKPIQTVPVNLSGGRSYEIHIGAGLVDILPQTIRDISANAQVLLVTDKTIADMHLAGVEMKFRREKIPMHAAVIPGGERSKNLTQYTNLLKRITEFDDARDVVIVAFGGGVVGDLAGFAAATYKRGVPLVQVPTTLLACVDSSVGGKTAVDLPTGKNLVGAFYQPRRVVIDLELLRTLPLRELRAGYAEALKTALIFDKKFFEYMEAELDAILCIKPEAMAHVVGQCCTHKAGVVQRDEFDNKGIRAVLNFGHTFGHAAEAALGYSRLRHGEAVAVGMLCAADLSAARGMVSQKTVARIQTHITAAGLPTAFKGCSADDIFKFIKYDKKFTAGRMRFILLEKPGKAVVADDVTVDEIQAAIAGRTA
jgi:3-dehydroquinate synthase